MLLLLRERRRRRRRPRDLTNERNVIGGCGWTWPGLAWPGLLPARAGVCSCMAAVEPQSGLQSPALTLAKLVRANIDWRRRRREDDGLMGV